MKKKLSCPCFSGSSYADCCAPYHQGEKDPENASILMRARFSAYSLDLSDFIIRTTVAKSATQHKNIQEWKQSIHDFHQSNTFKNLEIIDFKEHSDTAFVIFVIILKSDGRFIIYTEKSRFLFKNGKWFFQDSLLMDGKRSVKEMQNI